MFSYYGIMILGFFLAFLIFGPFAFFISRLVLSNAVENEKPFMGALWLFLALSFGLSLLSLIVLGGFSLLGLSAAAGVDALAYSQDVTPRFGGVTALGGLLIAAYGLFGFFTGPACAISAAAISSVCALLVLFLKADQRLVRTWFPLGVLLLVGFHMWPYTAYLTLGL